MASIFEMIDQIARDSAREKDRARQEEADRRGVPLATILAEEAEQRRLDDEKRAREQAITEQQRKDKVAFEEGYRKKFGASLGLAVPAHLGHIIVLGGLTARSSGNGTTRATVMHLVLDEDFTQGRLSRKKGDLLCRSRETIGHRRSFSVTGCGTWDSGDIREDWWHSAKLSCKSCQEILSRIQKAKPK